MHMNSMECRFPPLRQKFDARLFLKSTASFVSRFMPCWLSLQVTDLDVCSHSTCVSYRVEAFLCILTLPQLATIGVGALVMRAPQFATWAQNKYDLLLAESSATSY